MSNNYFTVLKAMFKNKLRIGVGKSKRSVIAFFTLIGVAYVMIMAILLSFIIRLAQLGALPIEIVMFIYLAMLITAAVIVMIFGIVNLITTLYLSKDTDFYSMLPIKSSVVFAAKLSYVYIMEMVIVAAITLPLMITLGIVVKAWAWFYIISILMMAVVPALPLVIAAILAIPVMYIASKLKNRAVVTLLFSIVLFGGLFALYLFFILSLTNLTVTEETAYNLINGINILLNVLYPYTALSKAVCGIPSFGLGVGASVIANLAICIGISVALFAVLMLLSRFMYSQSAKANNQTDNSKAKKGEFKTSSTLKAIMKREYLSAFRTTQVTFQCYVAMILPILLAVILGILCRSWRLSISGAVLGIDDYLAHEFGFLMMIPFCVLATVIPTVTQGSLTTFSREGNVLASLKTLPIDMKHILKGKVLAWLALAVPVAIISVAITNIFNFDLNYLFLSLFSIVPLSVLFVIFGALWDLASPKLKWTDPSQAVKHNGHATIGQLLMIAGGLISMLVMMGLYENNIDMEIISTVCWSIIYAILVIFGIVNIYLYRNVNAYYNRIEI